MEELFTIVFEYPKLKEYLQDRSQEKERAETLFKEIHGEFHPGLVRNGIRFLDATFGRLYDGIHLDVPADLDIKKLSENSHLILVPNHQSHADYLVLTYVLFGVYEIPIYIAGGLNLNVFPIGKFFRNTGAFFIRRSFQSDELYKLCFEAYIYFLLKKRRVIEFFFEGGRSRTGKLLPPRYGLFQMILEASSYLDDGLPLHFVPVTIAHEHVPEERAHVKELAGAKKKKESAGQLLKLVRLWERRLGTIHVRLGHPLPPPGPGDMKVRVQQLAFECFRAVGREMPVTPSSLLAFVLLNDPSGALTWPQIYSDCREILQHCEKFKIPLGHSLSGQDAHGTLKRALDLFLQNKKINQIEQEQMDLIFYAIDPEARVQLLYFKNMILHHFIVPVLMNMALFKVFSGKIKNAKDLLSYVGECRKELKFEFYLPPLKDMLDDALKILSDSSPSPVESFAQALELKASELFEVASSIRQFSTAFTSIYETHYIGALTLEYLGDQEFDEERYIKVGKELFEMEKQHGRVIQFPESFTVPKMKDRLSYLTEEGLVKRRGKLYRVEEMPKVQRLVKEFVTKLSDQLAINLRFRKA